MHIKSENLQALQSQQMITDALISLMKAYPYNDITITQICQEAQVVRQTFYRNFESKIDILEVYFDNLFQNHLSDYSYSEVMYQQLKSFFDYLLLHKEFLILIEKNNLFFLLNRTLAKYISKFSAVSKFIETIAEPKLDIYVLDFIVSTLCSILSLWVKNDFEDSSEKLKNLARTFFSGLENPMNLKGD